jgi:hypothetical protein
MVSSIAFLARKCANFPEEKELIGPAWAEHGQTHTSLFFPPFLLEVSNTSIP